MSQPVQTAARPSGRPKEIAAILVMAFAVLIVVSLHSTASGAVGVLLAHWLRMAFGAGADIPALLLFMAGFTSLKTGVRAGRVRRASSLVFAYLVLLASYHTLVTELSGPLSPYWALQTAADGGGGGRVGAFLCARALAAFGAWGSLVVYVTALFICITLYLETPVSRIVQRIAAIVRKLLSGSSRGVSDFGRGVVQEIRELFGLLKDKRALAVANREAVRESAPRKAPESPARPREERRNNQEGSASSLSPLTSLAGKVGSIFRKENSSEPTDQRTHRPPTSGSEVVPAPSPREDEAPDASASDSPTEGKDEGSPSSSQTPKTSSRTRTSKKKESEDESSDITAQPAADGQSEREPIEYALPTTALLHRPRDGGRQKKDGGDQSQLLEETLGNFGVQAKVVRVSRGPVVTRYELQPAPGIKVSKIVNLADDVSLSLAAADVRIEAPVPGKSVVGIEVPNKETATVYMREVLDSSEFKNASSKLVAGLGKDIAGNAVVADLTKLLHVLIAGATGSGKSVCINTIICSLLYKAHPDEVKLLMIDPKRVELAVYDGLPHLITPVVTDPKLAANALKWAVKEMESRYKKFSENGVRNIDGYNRQVDDSAIDDDRMPYLVVIIDELADLMLVAQNEVEDYICRLAQMARAAGIHLVIATQRPSVDVITGLIKANVPSRISFAVSSGVDSRTILDMMGAERLIGKGDMLYYPIGANKPLRAQGCWISDKEVQATVNFWKKQGDPEYAESVTEAAKTAATVDEGDDELFEDAVRLVVETGNASISMLQRRFRIGYARAARLIDMMELQGIVGTYQGSKPREVLRSADEISEMIGSDAGETGS